MQRDGGGGLTLNHMREEDRQILSAELGWGEGVGGRRRLTVDHSLRVGGLGGGGGGGRRLNVEHQLSG